MDVNSGAIHVVDDVVYDAIAMLEEKLGGLSLQCGSLCT